MKFKTALLPLCMLAGLTLVAACDAWDKGTATPTATATATGTAEPAQPAPQDRPTSVVRAGETSIEETSKGTVVRAGDVSVTLPN